MTIVRTEAGAVWWEGRAAGPQPLDPLPLPHRPWPRAQEWLTGAGLVGLDVPGRVGLPAGRLRARAGLGSRRRRLPGLPRPLRAIGGSRRAADPGLGATGGVGRRRSSSRATTRAPRCSSSAATSTASPSTSTTSPRSAPTSSTRRPVFPGESNHRYNATTFAEVDPLLGGDAAYARLSSAVHARGWRILGDLTTNHTGDTHEWFRRCARRRGRTRTGPSTTSTTTAPTPAGWATAPCPRSTTPTPTLRARDGRGTRLGGRVAGCSRRTTSTAGASTSPT